MRFKTVKVTNDTLRAKTDNTANGGSLAVTNGIRARHRAICLQGRWPLQGSDCDCKDASSSKEVRWIVTTRTLTLSRGCWPFQGSDCDCKDAHPSKGVDCDYENADSSKGMDDDYKNAGWPLQKGDYENASKPLQGSEL